MLGKPEYYIRLGGRIYKGKIVHVAAQIISNTALQQPDHKLWQKLAKGVIIKK